MVFLIGDQIRWGVGPPLPPLFHIPFSARAAAREQTYMPFASPIGTTHRGKLWHGWGPAMCTSMNGARAENWGARRRVATGHPSTELHTA